MQRWLMPLVPLLAGLIACSPGGPAADSELADALAEADEATVADFSGAMPRPCALLSRAEVEAAIGPLSGAAVQPPEQATDAAEARCQWQGEEGRVLRLAASGEGGLERLGAIEPSATPTITGSWDAATLQGCCLLHAVADDVLLSLDFSAAGIDLAQAAALMDRALARRYEPLDVP